MRIAPPLPVLLKGSPRFRAGVCRTSLVATALLFAFVPTLAWSQEHDPKRADQLFNHAKAAMARGELQLACAELAESQRLDPAPGTLLNLAKCEEKQNKVASAHAHVAEALRTLPKGDSREAYAKKQLADLDDRAPRLTVFLAEEAATMSDVHVTCDDAEVALGAPLRLNPGTHVVVVRLEGHDTTRESLTLAERESVPLVVRIGPRIAPPAPMPAPQTAPSAPPIPKIAPAPRFVPPPTPPRSAPLASPARAEDGPSSRPKWAAGFMIVGGLTAATGIVTGVMVGAAAGTYKENCKPEGCNDTGLDAASRGSALEVVSPVMLGAGGVIFALGLYLAATPTRAKGPARPAFAPMVGPGVAGAAFGGRF